MSLFGYLFSPGSSGTGAYHWHPIRGGGYQTAAGTPVNEWNALTLPAVYACVGLISDAIAQLPIRVYRQTDNGREHAVGHRVERMLNEAPNDRQTAFSFRKTMISHVLSWGNGYAEIERTNGGEPVALYLALPDRTNPELTMDGELIFHTTIDRQTKTVESPDVIHVPALGFDGVVGYSPVAIARQALGLAKAQEEYGSRFFANDAKSGGFIKHPGKLSEQAVHNLRESFAAQGGPENAHKPKVLEEGAEFQQTTIPPEDAQFLECVSEETLISMADGSRKRADHIEIGDMVVGWDDGPTASRVANVCRKPKKPLVHIETARGRNLTVTADHPFLAKTRLRTLGGRPDTSEPEWINAGELEQGQYIRVGLGYADHYVKAEDGLEADKSWLLGLLVGDAHVSDRTCELTCAEGSIVSEASKVVNTLGASLKHRGKFSYSLAPGFGNGCKGSELRHFLNAAGLPGSHSHTKRVPNLVLTSGPLSWASFLSGYLDADGSVSAPESKGQPKVYWSSTSRCLLEDCQHMLAMLGINAGIYDMNESGLGYVRNKLCNVRKGYGLFVTGYEQLRKLSHLLTPAHNGKADKLKAFAELSAGSRYREHNWTYDRIKSVTPMGVGETVGIEIEGTHTHITQGLVSHNSRTFQIGEIARMYRVPLHMIQEVSGSTSWGSGLSEMSMGFVRFTLAPWMTPIEQEMNRKLFTTREREQGYYVSHDTSDLLRGDLTDRSEYYTRALDPETGWLTREEVRASEDKDPLDDDQAAGFSTARGADE